MGTSLRVLHVAASYRPAWRHGGPVEAAHAMATGTAALGAEVRVLTTNANGLEAMAVPTDAHVPLDGILVRYHRVHAPRRLSASVDFAAHARSAVRAADIVHIHGALNWPVTTAAWACRKEGIPYVLRPAGILDPITLAKAYEAGPRARATAVAKQLYLALADAANVRAAAGVHCTSPREGQALRSLGLDARSFVLPLGVPSPPSPSRAAAEATRSSLGAGPDAPLVLYLSRLDPKKGLDVLLGALGRLTARGRGFVLAVAGRGEPAFEDALREEVRREGLADRTRFLGHVAGAPKAALLAAADVFALPSHHENFGMAVGEAMAAGVPVVISDGVYLAEEVRGSGAGVVVPRDPARWAEALDALLADPALRRAMGERGRALARERYDPEAVCRQLLGVYEDILRGAPVARDPAGAFKGAAA